MTSFMQNVVESNQYLSDEDRDALIVAVYQALHEKQRRAAGLAAGILQNGVAEGQSE